MRQLASFRDPTQARSLDALLSAAEIPTVVRSADDGSCAVWLVSEQDTPKALQLLQAFVARQTRVHAEQQRAAVSLRQRLQSAVAATPVVAGLFALCVLVALYTKLGDYSAGVEHFTIARGNPEALRPESWRELLVSTSTQWWRLFTPVLLHFHPFHLLFNAFWLRDLGVPTERYQGSLQFTCFLLLSAAVSNLAQLIFGHSPNFGGLSGVVYALIGYLWARGRADPSSGINVPNAWVIFFVGWMALGFTGVLNGLLGGGVANYCHLGGFATGAVYGYIAAQIARSRASR
jgi:GlpG protein